MKISCIATAMVVTTTLGASAIVSTVAIGHDNSNKPIPRYSNGVVIFYERTRPALTVYDREGRRLSQTVLRIEGADVINILDVAADSSGRTIAAASVRSHDGRQVVSALIWSGVNGQIERVVRLDSFAARRVSVTPAGPVFAFGAERDTGGRDTANHQMALLFSAEGKMVSSLAHRSTFASAPIHPSSDGFLFSNRQSFGVFSPLSGIYAEFSLTGQQTGTWAVPPRDRVDFTGGGLTESGQVFIGGQDSDTGSPFALKLDRATGTWKPIEIPAKFAVPIGIEGERLMLYGRPPSIIGLQP